MSLELPPESERSIVSFAIKAATLQYLGRVVWSVEQALALINACDHTIQTLMLEVLCNFAHWQVQPQPVTERRHLSLSDLYQYSLRY